MGINVGYAWAQLARAQAAGNAEAVGRWQDVLRGMASGTLAIGSRTPIAAPAWVTLDVVHGGFATGRYVAAERDLERALKLLRDESVLDGMLARGDYVLGAPEHGALLVVAWLRAHGDLDAARRVLDAIEPWLGTLRFAPRARGAKVAARDTRIAALDEVAARAAVARRQEPLDRMHHAIDAVGPAHDVELGLLDDYLRGVDDREAWAARAKAALTDPPVSKRRSVVRVRASLQAAVAGEASPMFLHAARELVAACVAKRGAPGSVERVEFRRHQRAAVRDPRHTALREVVVARAMRHVPAGGLSEVELDELRAPVRADEATAAAPAGTSIPAYLASKLLPALDAPVERLLARGAIASAEVLAAVLPQVDARAIASGIADLQLRGLYVALYASFRARRSLLLVNYEHQVQFEELPWVAALAPYVQAGAQVRETFARVGELAVTSFPQSITPNKLVSELSALARHGGIDVALCEELAVDIFQGSLTTKFQRSAQVAAARCAGTLYARYYALDTAAIAGFATPTATPTPTGSSVALAPQLVAMCEARAELDGVRSFTVRNGKILEQVQIVTTHNLAALSPSLDATRARGLAERCLRSAGRMLLDGGLRRLKNAAYAWRQMVFFLSSPSLDADDVLVFADWARAHVHPRLRPRMEPAFRGLELAASGVTSSDPAFTAGGGRVVLGWTAGPHWLA